MKPLLLALGVFWAALCFAWILQGNIERAGVWTLGVAGLLLSLWYRRDF
jgi:hypothetical protein